MVLFPALNLDVEFVVVFEAVASGNADEVVVAFSGLVGAVGADIVERALVSSVPDSEVIVELKILEIEAAVPVEGDAVPVEEDAVPDATSIDVLAKTNPSQSTERR